MRKEKTLDEALDEMDRWADRVVQAIQGLSREERVEYFRKAKSRLEKKLGRKLNLKVEAPRSQVP